MSDVNIPWPRKGEKLFSHGDDWWHNACLNYLHDNTHLVQMGYRCGAETLVEKAMSQRSELDALIYPIVFLYRHYLELSLKRIIVGGAMLVHRDFRSPRGHRLWVLWQEARGILEKIWPDSPKEDIEAVEECIRELDNKDPTSQSFRYTETTAGERPLEELRLVNIRNFAEVIGRVANLLECCDTAITEYLDCQQTD